MSYVMCINKECRLKEKCWRYINKIGNGKYEKFEIENGKCKYYLMKWEELNK